MSSTTMNSSPNPFDGHGEQSAEVMFERYGHVREVELGEQIFTRGNRGDSMFLIREGQIELLFKGGKEPKRLGPGEVFGELAFVIGDHERSATAVAVTPARLLELNQQSFSQLSTAMPEALFNLLRNTCRYLLSSESNLIEGLEERRRELELAMDFLRRTREELGLTVTPSDTDPLTGLYNQRSLFEQLDNTLLRGEPGALLLLRLDGVESVNRALGHDYGDMVINNFASNLRDTAGMQSFPSRLGGSLFALLLKGFEPEQSEQQVELLFSAIGERKLDLPEHDLKLCATLVGDIPLHQEGGEQLYQRLRLRLEEIEQECERGPVLCWSGQCRCGNNQGDAHP